MQNANSTPVLEVSSNGEFIDLDVVYRCFQIIEYNGHAASTFRENRHVVYQTRMLSTGIPVVLNAVQSPSSVSIKNIDADINGLTPAGFLLLTVAPTCNHDSKYQVPIPGKLHIL